MNSGQTIVERLVFLFVEKFHIDVPSVDIDLLESGIIDSFQFIELLLLLEEHFNLRVRIETIELDDLRTLARIARLVETHRLNPASSVVAPAFTGQNG